MLDQLKQQEFAQSIRESTQRNNLQKQQLGLSRQNATNELLQNNARMREQARQFDLTRGDRNEDNIFERGFKEKAYGDSRDDALWGRGFKERAYGDERSDVLRRFSGEDQDRTERSAYNKARMTDMEDERKIRREEIVQRGMDRKEAGVQRQIEKLAVAQRLAQQRMNEADERGDYQTFNAANQEYQALNAQMSALLGNQRTAAVAGSVAPVDYGNEDAAAWAKEQPVEVMPPSMSTAGDTVKRNFEEKQNDKKFKQDLEREHLSIQKEELKLRREQLKEKSELGDEKSLRSMLNKANTEPEAYKALVEEAFASGAISRKEADKYIGDNPTLRYVTKIEKMSEAELMDTASNIKTSAQSLIQKGVDAGYLANMIDAKLGALQFERQALTHRMKTARRTENRGAQKDFRAKAKEAERVDQIHRMVEGDNADRTAWDVGMTGI